MSGRRVVVIGGGAVAARKTKLSPGPALASSWLLR